MQKHFFIIPIILLSSTAFGYSPSDKDKLKNTGTCLNCDLSGTSLFLNSEIKPPFNISGSNISNSSLDFGNATNSDFSNIIAINSSFNGRWSYSNSSFRNAKLMKASLGGNLNFADFTGADMTDTNLNNTNLYGAKGIDFKQVKSVCNAIMPDGSEGKCSKDWKDNL